MQDVWLVSLPKAEFRPYIERFRVFDTAEAAYAHARSEGWEDAFGLGINDKVGMLNSYACGDVWVDVIHLQIS